MGNTKCKILFLGLDNAGKTSIITYFENKGTLEQVEEPTVGFVIKGIKYKRVDFKIWDVAGKESVRPLWKHYYEVNDAVVFVIDASDHKRIDEAVNTLKSVCREPELEGSILLVLANKQDIPGAMEAKDIKAKIEGFIGQKRVWECLPTTTKIAGGELVQQSFWWLGRQIREKKPRKKIKLRNKFPFGVFLYIYLFVFNVIVLFFVLLTFLLYIFSI